MGTVWTGYGPKVAGGAVLGRELTLCRFIDYRLLVDDAFYLGVIGDVLDYVLVEVA